MNLMTSQFDFYSEKWLRMPRLSSCFFSLLLTFFLQSMLFGNHVTFSNISLEGHNSTSKTVKVQFDISWENSWRTSSAPNNWDAAWVFVKYKEKDTGLWKHAWLNDSGHTAPSGSTISVGIVDVKEAYNADTNPGVGAFIYRSSDGTGTFSVTNAELLWNYGKNGLTYSNIEEIRVFALEMVYVPQGTFTLGSGATNMTSTNFSGTTVAESGSFKAGNTTNSPYTVGSENAINIANTTGNLYGTNIGQIGTLAFSNILNSGTTATLPAEFPKGYGAFYCMKHELGQQAYVDFLNTLTRFQQSRALNAIVNTPGYNVFALANAAAPAYRNGIRTSATLPASGALTFYCDLNNDGTSGDANDGEFVACNYMDAKYGLAYLDWAGLRPLTEMEFEKACRGTSTAVAGEFPWGGSSGAVSQNDKTISNPGYDNELPDATANTVFNGFTTSRNEMRVGSFARSATNRTAAGATYYGILDMAGNLGENFVTVSRAEGRIFNGGVHGDGTLVSHSTMRAFSYVEADALYNVPNWPAMFGAGLGTRGGTVMATTGRLRVSDRGYAYSPSGLEQAGLRGGRSAQ